MIATLFSLFVASSVFAENNITACHVCGSDTTSAAPKTVAEAISQAKANSEDLNHNNLRDDVAIYIASQPDTEPQKASLIQLSSALTLALTINTSNHQDKATVSSRIANAISCIHYRYEPVIATDKVNDIQKYTVNTKDRFIAYNKYNASQNGSTFTLPQGDGCAK